MNYKNINDFELIYLVKENNEDALNFFFKKYEPLISKIANYYYTNVKDLKIEYEDLLQEGRIGLYEAIKCFEIKQEVLFYTFAFLCIKRAIVSYLKRNTTNKKMVLASSLSFDETILNENISFLEPTNILEEKYFINKIIEFKNSLDFIDSNIFELRLSSFSYSDIASLLDTNVKNVDNRLIKIRNKLKKYLLQCN